MPRDSSSTPVTILWVNYYEMCCRHVLRGEHGLGVEDRTQSKEQRLRKSRDLRCVVHMDDEVSSSSTFYVCEVGCLGLKVFEYGLKGVTDLAVFGERIPLFHGNAER